MCQAVKFLEVSLQVGCATGANFLPDMLIQRCRFFVKIIQGVVARTSILFCFKQPQIFSDISWQVTLVKLVYASFYLLMSIIPITGLFLLQAGGKEALFFGYALPEVIAPDRELKKIIKEIHEFLSNGFYLLIILHVAAAFWHQYILKDDSFKRMRL